MARRGGFIVLIKPDLAKFNASFQSIGEAACSAHLDDLRLVMANGAMTFEGMAIVSITSRWEATKLVMTIKPTAAMILYIGWLMTRLPAHATVTWRDGWPHIHCPPRDPRDTADDPTPLRPEALLPA